MKHIDPNSPNFKGDYSKPRPAGDDWQEGDLNSIDAGEGGVLKTRMHQGMTIETRNPHGFAYVVELPDLGTFTTIPQAIQAIDTYVAKNKEKAIG